MPKPRPLTASECARLTGITVKALRVYESSGLIKPARSGNGYRIYGQRELVRLNAIATLKSVGLTLAQIREALEASSPRLPRILQMQLDEWRARRAAAEKAMVIVEAALVRVSARETLSIEELCQLIRSIEMSNVQQVTRTLINESLTPEEEREWSTYYATLSPEETALHREHFETSRTITQELLRLMNAGAEPGSTQVQALIERSNELNARCRFREGYVERLEWNAPLTRKLLALGQRLVATTAAATVAGATEAAKTSEDFADFMSAAHRASKAGQALAAGPLREARALLARGVKPDSTEARAVARRFAEICSLHNLGTPLAYARWIVEFGPIMRGKETTKLYRESGEAWRFIADATAALAT